MAHKTAIGVWLSPIRFGIQAHSELIGFCINIAGAIPSNVSKVIQTGGAMPSDHSAYERHTFERLKLFFTKFVASTLEMGNRPLTLYGIADS
jgi:hypothetical protein